jgi:hypothetical protein
LRSFLKEGGISGGASPKGIYGFRKREVAMKAGYGDKGLRICFSVNGLLLSSKDTSSEWDWENKDVDPSKVAIEKCHRGQASSGTTRADSRTCGQ